LSAFTGWHRPDDVRISRVRDGEGADSEVFTTGCSQLDVVARIMVDTSLGQHGIVFNLGFPKMKKNLVQNLLLLLLGE
jgi:hypothetical protein